MSSINQTDVIREISFFLVDRKAQQLSEWTIDFYGRHLRQFSDFLTAHGIKNVTDITANDVRAFLLKLEETRSKGGIFAAYRVIRVFLNWYERETEVEDWKNPIHKVRMKNPNQEPLPGIPMSDVKAMIMVCSGKTFYDLRDKAIIQVLVDSGVRRSELLALNLDDIDLDNGSVLVRSGKGGRSRTTFVGAKTRRTLVRYLRNRKDNDKALFVSRFNRRLSSKGLDQVIRKRAKQAKVKKPGIHDFRRTFAVECLRNGIDVFSLMRLMGHKSPTVLMKYLRLVTDDIQKAHEKVSPVDRSKI